MKTKSETVHFWRQHDIRENPIIKENFKFSFHKFINPVLQPCQLLNDAKSVKKTLYEKLVHGMVYL
jgi:hypothetical protein